MCPIIHSHVPKCVTHCATCSWSQAVLGYSSSDTQVERIHLFAHVNICYPTTRRCSYFLTIFVAHLRVYTRMMGCNRSLTHLKHHKFLYTFMVSFPRKSLFGVYSVTVATQFRDFPSTSSSTPHGTGNVNSF